MESEEGANPTEINKSPEIIKAAQEDIGNFDVLVCGKCHEVSYFVDDFVSHQQSGNCTGISTVRENYKNESNSQVWAFMLWKNAQSKKLADTDAQLTPWSMYQNWSKLKPEEKQTWIMAGDNIHSFTKIGSAKLYQVRQKTQSDLKTNKTATRNNVKDNSEDEEPLEEGEIRLSELSDAQRIAIRARVAANKNNMGNDSAGDSDVTSDEDIEKQIDKSNRTSEANKKSSLKPVQHNNDNVITSIINRPAALRKALHTKKDETTEEAIVESLLKRRFNQKKKCFEYFVKWENLDESENSWEPKAHFENCKGITEEFDKIFNKMRLTSKITQKKLIDSEINLNRTPGGRPQRTSKQKALDQVKAWCGNINSGEESGKRKLFSEDDDSTDSFEKKIKLEGVSDSSDEEKPSVTIRKIAKAPNSLNGVAKKTSDVSPAAPQRVVRVTQKQLPNLATGVYIMSKTGIIKVDSNTSTGNPVFKVGPKIGDTHIKMVKKDSSNIKTPLRPGPKPKTYEGRGANATPRSITKVITHRKLDTQTSTTRLPSQNNTSLNKSWVDDESDGLEELDFPTDLPIPEPDSPPGEFTLCPLTGKILGGPDEPEQEPQLQTESTNENATTLDGLVKLAVTDLPDDVINQPVENVKDNKNVENIQSPKPDVTITPKPGNVISSETPQKSNKVQIVAAVSADVETSIKRTAIARAASGTPVKKPTMTTSILSAALTTTRIPPLVKTVAQPQRKLLSTPQSVRHKVTTISRVTPTNRSAMLSPNATIIHKVSPSRTKPIAPKTTLTMEPVLKKSPNVTTYKPANVARRIGNTTIYKTSVKPSTPVTKTTPSHTTAVTTTPPQPTLVQTATSTGINMPSLTTEESSASTAATTTSVNEATPLANISSETGLADLSTFTLADSETPLLITGDDGTIYQVAGQNEDGQTILISEGPDGQQQCVIVSSDSTAEETPTLIMDTSQTETATPQPLAVNTQEELEEESQVVAQIIKADPPSPGGTRKVVLMLPDGNYMMTDVSAEQYAALELDK